MALDKYPIKIVAFEILERCNLFCDFCVRSAHHKLTGTLSVRQFSDRVARLKEDFPELKHIALTGGEPFIHKSIVEMARIARLAASSVSITTNGTILNKDLMKEFFRLNGVHFIISIDAAKPEIHDEIRGMDGTFDRLTEFAQYCRSNNQTFLVNMTVSEKNVGEIYDTVRYAKKLGAGDISVALVKPEGRGYRIADEQRVLVQAGIQVAAAKKQFESNSFRVRFTEPLAHIFDVRLAETGRIGGCGAAANSLHIQCDGTILICTSCKETLGNVEDYSFSLKDRVNEDARLEAIKVRDKLGGACGSCEFKLNCGGCRCRAVCSDDGFLGPDVLCPKNVPPDSDSKEIADLHQKFINRLNKISPSLAGHEVFELEVLTKNLAKVSFRPGKKDIHVGTSGLRGAFTGLFLGFTGANVFSGHLEDKEIELCRSASEALNIQSKFFNNGINTSDKGIELDFIIVSDPWDRFSDVPLGIKALSKSMKEKGAFLFDVETSKHPGGLDEYVVSSNGVKKGWFHPGRLAMFQMLEIAGFGAVEIVDFLPSRRLSLKAARAQDHKQKAGTSMLTVVN